MAFELTVLYGMSMRDLRYKGCCWAQAIGLAHLDAASHLCLHPKYGPWFSLRALLVFDGVPFHGERLYHL